MSIKQFIKESLQVVSGTRLLKKQLQYTKYDLQGLVADTKKIRSALKQKKTRVDQWNTFVHKHAITAEQLIQQYQKRRLMAVILAGVIVISLYILMVDDFIFPGLAGTLIAVSIYFKNALRLYQIRQRELCQLTIYLQALKRSFKELLPLALPSDWNLMQKPLEGNCHDI